MSVLAPATPVPATRCLRILWSADDTAFGARRVQTVFLCDRVGEWPGLPMQKQVRLPNRRFRLVLIKPSHYDDDGYVIRWWRAMIPSNSLAAIYGIAADCAERQVLGPDIAFAIEVIDETNTRVNVPQLLERFRSNGNFGLVALVGVQSNQYPRALDIARPFRAAGIPVAMGGFHVSGCLSMLDGRAVDLDASREMGVAMFAGEAEGRLDLVLRDAAEGRLAPVYDFMKDLPGMQGTPVPFLLKRYVARSLGLSS